MQQTRKELMKKLNILLDTSYNFSRLNRLDLERIVKAVKAKLRKNNYLEGKMKPEPLKSKVVYVGNLCKDKNNYNLRVVPEKVELIDKMDIKSAVEWLKNQIMPDQKIKEFTQWQIIDLIDKAFEDVVKKE